LPGNIEGAESDINKLVNASLYLASGQGQNRTEVIYYPDETKAIQQRHQL